MMARQLANMHLCRELHGYMRRGVTILLLGVGFAIGTVAGDTPSPQPGQTAVSALVAELNNGDGEKRREVADRLLKIGPAAIPDLMKFVAAHLGDDDESAWQAGYRAIEGIIETGQDDRALDSWFVNQPKPEPRWREILGIRFVWIPAGWFIGGTSLKPDRNRQSYERPGWRNPVRRVLLPGYWITETEVTRADAERLALVAPHEPPPLPSSAAWSFAGAPASLDAVVDIAQPQPFGRLERRLAELFKPLGFAAALPTEDEWEKAARGTDGRIYVWGNQYSRGKEAIGGAPCTSTGKPDFNTPWCRKVGVLPIDTSPYGVKDMQGNLNEAAIRTGPQLPILEYGTLVRKGSGFVMDSGYTVGNLGYRTMGGPLAFRFVLRPLAPDKPEGNAAKKPE